MEVIEEAAKASWQALNVFAHKLDREKFFCEIGHESVYHRIPAIY